MIAQLDEPFTEDSRVPSIVNTPLGKEIVYLDETDAPTRVISIDALAELLDGEDRS